LFVLFVGCEARQSLLSPRNLVLVSSSLHAVAELLEILAFVKVPFQQDLVVVLVGVVHDGGVGGLGIAD
jgi:hypothetical protein